MDGALWSEDDGLSALDVASSSLASLGEGEDRDIMMLRQEGGRICLL